MSQSLTAGDEPRAWTELSDEIPAVSQPGRFSQLLDALGEPNPEGVPGLYLAHILLPHQPWRFLPDGSTYAEPQRSLVSEFFGYAEAAPWHARVHRQRHILQMQYADALIGQLTERLEAVDLYDEALVVVMADHGAAFTAGEGLRMLTDGNRPEIMWAPLFIKAPFQQGAVRTDVNAQSPDVLPTLAEILGVEIPWAVDGTSLAGVDGSEASTGTKRYIPFEHGGDVSDAYEVDGAKGLRAMLDLAFDPPARGADWMGGLYAVHPNGDLVDREVASLRVRTGAGPVARIDSLDRVLASDPSPHVNITGVLDGVTAPQDEVHVAVALNGHIVGVSPIEDIKGIGPDGDYDEVIDAFEVLAHPSWFVRGEQELAVYQILRSDSGGVELLQLEVRSS